MNALAQDAPGRPSSAAKTQLLLERPVPRPNTVVRQLVTTRANHGRTAAYYIAGMWALFAFAGFASGTEPVERLRLALLAIAWSGMVAVPLLLVLLSRMRLPEHFAKHGQVTWGRVELVRVTKLHSGVVIGVEISVAPDATSEPLWVSFEARSIEPRQGDHVALLWSGAHPRLFGVVLPPVGVVIGRARPLNYSRRFPSAWVASR